MSHSSAAAASVDATPKSLPVVSIVIPCRNEKEFIANCLESIIASTYPKENLEVLVADGMSRDGTRTVLAEYHRRHPWIRILDNPKQTTPFAMNIGISGARGDFVMIMSAHAEYDVNAIEETVRLATASSADNVGGVWLVQPRGNTFWDRCAVLALSNPFGVGSAHYRIGMSHEPRWTDTAAFGCYRKDVFARVGMMNEKLTHSQDMEFNLRLKKAGGRTLLVPKIRVKYYARTDFKSFCLHSFRNGIWVIKPFLYSEIFPVAWRHLVPLTFVTTLLSFLVLASIPPLGWVPLAVICSAYLICALLASAGAALKQKDPRIVLGLPLYFFALHITYGVGSLWGCAQVLGAKFWSWASEGVRAADPGSVEQPAKQSIDFSTVSEVPGNRITREAMEMLRTRYAFAAGLAEGKEVLEVACGSGQGLGALASHASRLVGGDYSQALLASAQRHYSNRVPLLRFSAEAMPFPTGSFDLVICLEAMYYFPNAERFIEECRRVLRPGGMVLLCTANKEWRGFAPGALTTRYFSARELSELLGKSGFYTKVMGAFPDAPDTLFRRMVSLIRTAAVSLRLIPKTMRAKEPLKRLFYGPLLEVPAEITLVKSSDASVTPITPDSQASTYKVIYAIGRR